MEKGNASGVKDIIQRELSENSRLVRFDCNSY